MKAFKFAALGLAVSLLASCGGSSSTPSTGTDTSLPTLTVTLSEASQTVTVPEGGSTVNFGFGASYTGTSNQPVVASVVLDAERYQLVGTPTGSGSNYTVNLATLPYAPGGLSTSTIVFRLCTTADCTSVYPGSIVTYTVNLDVQVKDWETEQRLANHNGYLDVNYDKSNFVQKWAYSTAAGSTLGASAAGRGRVFLTEKASDGHYYGVGINSYTGARIWRVDLGTDTVSDPAYHDLKVYYTSSAASGTKTPMVVDAEAGTLTTLPAYTAPVGAMNQPVPYDTGLYLIAGGNGMVAHAYDLAAGTLAWQRDFGGTIDSLAALAVNDSSAYAFAGSTIQVLSRASGAVTGALTNPGFTSGTQYASAPVLGTDALFAYTRAHAYTDASPIAGWALTGGAPLWTSTASYVYSPVLGLTRLFAVNAAQRRIEAINPATGAVDYTIAIPGTGTLTGSLVSSRSHLFVSTSTDTYAFSLASGNAQDFTVALGGKLAITPDNQLVISQGTKATSIRLW